MRITFLIILFLILHLKLCIAFEGLATYYTIDSCKREGTSGIFTASGERFNEADLTCALPWKPDNKLYIVYSPETEKSIVVRHNDFGPGKGPRRRGVVIDLTPAGWHALGYKMLHENGNGEFKVNVMEVK